MSDDTQTQQVDLANDVASEQTNETELTNNLASDIEKEIVIENNAEKQEGVDEKEEKTEENIPEKYDLQYPEGFEVYEGVHNALQDVFKKSKMTQDQAQLFAQEIVNIQNVIQNVMLDEQKKNINNTYEGWKTELSQNPNFSGQEYKKSVLHIQNALKHITANTDENSALKIKEIFYAQSESNPNGYGLMNNPAIAEMLRIVGKTISQDSAIFGKTPTKPKTLAEQFYGRG